MDITSFLIGFKKGKSAGGGSSDDVRYVTFMNGDTVLYVKPVAVGDDCADVVTRGLIETPTKESTVSTVYTYSGWSLTNGGSASSSALSAVTEDRTVYAAFEEEVREYTINFYDGETLLESQSVAYGSTPSITDPTKDGYSFDGWNPTISAVTGDQDYYAQWAEAVTFASGSWADIVRIAESGEAQNYFALGDQREFSFSDPEGNAVTTTLEIVDFGVDDLADGTGKAAMTIVTRTSTFMQAAVASSGIDYFWSTSLVRTALNNTVLASFPTELQNGIKSVTKKTRKYMEDGSTTGLEETNDKLWALSIREFGYKSNITGYNIYPETEAHGYTKISSASYLTTLDENVGKDIMTRTGRPNSAGYYIRIQNTGSNSVQGSRAAHLESYVLFGFCI